MKPEGKILAPGASDISVVQKATASPSLSAMLPPGLGGRKKQKLLPSLTAAIWPLPRGVRGEAVVDARVATMAEAARRMLNRVITFVR